MTLEEKLKELEQKKEELERQKREIENSIEEIENQIEEEKLKQLAEGFSAYDLLYWLSKHNKYLPLDIEMQVAYKKAREMITVMRENKEEWKESDL